jgi:dUTP pyrophosphatase
VRVPVVRLHPDAVLPRRQTEGAAGLDLCACLGPGERVSVDPGARVLVATGLAIAIPRGFEGQVRPRSGLAWRCGLTVLNAPGTIDADYRGELKVLLVNLGHEAVSIEHADRIAQLVIAPVIDAACEWAESLAPTERGEGGFGSTGQTGT